MSLFWAHYESVSRSYGKTYGTLVSWFCKANWPVVFLIPVTLLQQYPQSINRGEYRPAQTSPRVSAASLFFHCAVSRLSSTVFMQYLFMWVGGGGGGVCTTRADQPQMPGWPPPSRRLLLCYKPFTSWATSLFADPWQFNCCLSTSVIWLILMLFFGRAGKKKKCFPLFQLFDVTFTSKKGKGTMNFIFYNVCRVLPAWSFDNHSERRQIAACESGEGRLVAALLVWIRIPASIMSRSFQRCPCCRIYVNVHCCCFFVFFDSALFWISLNPQKVPCWAGIYFLQ